MIGGERHDRRAALALGNIRCGHPLEGEFVGHGLKLLKKKPNGFAVLWQIYKNFAVQKLAAPLVPSS
jgi:hypothetical protein